MGRSREFALQAAAGERITFGAAPGTELAAERTSTPDIGSEELLRTLREVVQDCLAELLHLNESQLDIRRAVGRAAHPSTVRGILHHAAEHAARHSGQVVTTARIVSYPTTGVFAK